jgi:hypothetical protein
VSDAPDLARHAHPAHLERLPWHVRLLDAVGVAFILIGMSVIVTGGFREWTPLGRISMTSWARPLAIGVIALLVRHAMYRSPTLPHRLFAGMRGFWSTPEPRAITAIFLSTRLGVLVVGFLGITMIGYAPNTPPWRVYANDLLNLPARWDAGWYLGVAIEGYIWKEAEATDQQNIAFFPAYPMLMRYGALFLARQTLWVGVLISLVSFFFALRYLFRLARATLDEDAAIAAVAFLAAYPFAFFFSAPYTEALFLLASLGAFYHFERDELIQAAIWGLVAGLTRPNGCLLSIPLALLALRPLLARRNAPGEGGSQASLVVRSVASRLAIAAMPGIGMLIFSTFIYSLTGNPLQWAAQNAAWGRVYRGLDHIVQDRVRYVNQYGFYDYASSRSLDLLQSVAVLFAIASVWPVYRRFGLHYAVLLVINLVTPLMMGGLLSMGRVTSVLFPTFLWLGAAVPPRQRSGWLLAFAMLQALCAIVFFTWRPLY